MALFGDWLIQHVPAEPSNVLGHVRVDGGSVEITCVVFLQAKWDDSTQQPDIVISQHQSAASVAGAWTGPHALRTDRVRLHQGAHTLAQTVRLAHDVRVRDFRELRVDIPVLIGSPASYIHFIACWQLQRIVLVPQANGNNVIVEAKTESRLVQSIGYDRTSAYMTFFASLMSTMSAFALKASYASWKSSSETSRNSPSDMMSMVLRPRDTTARSAGRSRPGKRKQCAAESTVLEDISEPPQKKIRPLSVPRSKRPTNQGSWPRCSCWPWKMSGVVTARSRPQTVVSVWSMGTGVGFTLLFKFVCCCATGRGLGVVLGAGTWICGIV